MNHHDDEQYLSAALRALREAPCTKCRCTRLKVVDARQAGPPADVGVEDVQLSKPPAGVDVARYWATVRCENEDCRHVEEREGWGRPGQHRAQR